MNWTLVGSVATLVLLAFTAIVMLIGAMVAAHSNKLKVISDLKTEWQSNKDSWVRCFLLYEVAATHKYQKISVTATPGQKAQVYEMYMKFSSNGGHNLSDEEKLSIIMEQIPRARSISAFFVYCNKLITASKITPSELYSIIGYDIIKYRTTLIWLSGNIMKLDSTSTSQSLDWENDVLPTITMFSDYDSGENILMLSDLIWAESIRIGGTDLTSAILVAIHKNSHLSSYDCENRVKLLTKTSSTSIFTWPRRRITRYKLVKLYKNARKIPVKHFIQKRHKKVTPSIVEEALEAKVISLPVLNRAAKITEVTENNKALI